MAVIYLRIAVQHYREDQEKFGAASVVPDGDEARDLSYAGYLTGKLRQVLEGENANYRQVRLLVDKTVTREGVA